MLNHARWPQFDQFAASGPAACPPRRWRSALPRLGGLWLAGLLCWGSALAWGQETSPKPAAEETPPATATEATDDPDKKPEGTGEDTGAKKEPPFQIRKSWRRVTKDHEVWIDFSKKQVIVGGHICLREGMLEMFACPQDTKEHESIVATHSPAVFVHAALIAVGAKAGPPVQFDPEYRPAQGTEIAVEVLWKNAAGEEQRARAQEWVKHVKTGEELKYPWVFAGSGFWTDEKGKEWYYGDSGDFICVSNFSSATMDLPVESGAANETLLYSPFKDRIPPLDTPVLLVLTPKLPSNEEETEKQKGEKPEKKQPEEKPPTAEGAEPAKEAASPPATEDATKKAPVESPTEIPAGKQSPAEPKKDTSC